MRKPILCLDFDGVVHSYASGWKGAGIVSDPPVPGALQFIRAAMAEFTVAIYSSRSGTYEGREAMRRWLSEHARREFEPEKATPPLWVGDIEWPTEKPPAFVTLADRAITFTGTWPDVESLKKFRPWNKP